jgi:hypothetical protein
MATLFEVLQFFDNNGNPLSNGLVYTDEAGTSTPKICWMDAAETSQHTNPIVLDAGGRPPGGAIFIRGSYKFRIFNYDETIEYPSIDYINEYDSTDLTGLTASIADLNSTTTTAKDIGGVPPLVYTVQLDDRGKTLMVNALTANATINLPSALSVGNTFKIWIKKTDKSTNTVTIVPFGGETIDGATTKVLYDYNDFAEIRADGSNWFVGGSLIRGTIASTTSALIIGLEDDGKIFNCDASGGAFNITLPACNVVGRGFWVGFKKIDSSQNEITLKANGSETIDGDADYYVHMQWQYTQIKTDGNNWFIMDESGSTSEFITGDIKVSINKTQNGWVWMNDGSIGSANSGATSRAADDTKQLYILMWNTFSDTWCPVAGGRGASAENDFNAAPHGKALTLYKTLGRAIVQIGKAVEHDWQPGESYGEDRHVQSIPEMASHSHVYTNSYQNPSPLNSHSGGSLPYAYGYNANTWGAGGNTSFNIIQPSVAAGYYLIKL